MDLRILLLASVLAISASNALDKCCLLEVWGNCLVPCPGHSDEVNILKIIVADLMKCFIRVMR